MTLSHEHFSVPSAGDGQVMGGPHYPQGYAPDPQQTYYQQPGVPATPPAPYAQPVPPAYEGQPYLVHPEPQAGYAPPHAPAGPQAYYAQHPAPPVHYAGSGAANELGLGNHVFPPGPPIGPVQGRKRWPWVAGGVVVSLSVAGAAAFAFTAQSGPTAEEAKRACETAFINEMDARQEKANNVSDLAIGNTNGVDVADPYPIDGGFEVNGTGHYTVVTPLTSLPGTVELTCTATRNDDGGLATTVANRGGTTTS